VSPGASDRDLAVLGEALQSAGIDASPDHDLAALATYRVGGRAAWFVTVGSIDQLMAIGEIVARFATPTLVVGRGSNLLVADSGFAGLALQLGESFATINVGDRSIAAGGAAALPVVARRSVSAGFSGFEWAVGVPGSIGGAVRMNAGGHGSDMAASVQRVRVVDLATGQDVTMSASDCAFAYRSSSIGPHQVVVEVELALAANISAAGERELSEIVAWRRQHQPGGQNAGSVFANPTGDSAGRLIDIAGCKGRRIGTAEVSMKHANFIQVDAGGSADDVVSLMAAVRRAVSDSTGHDLRAETVMVGFNPEVVAGAGGRL